MKSLDHHVDVGRFLQSLPATEILYCPNPGNAGDSAIAAGTYHLFDRIGLHHRSVGWNEDFDASGKTLVYGGGGNLIEKYPHARSFIERHHRSAERLIVLPHTIFGNEDLLRQLGPNITLFCREERSFEWVREHTRGPSVYLDHDMAFRLDAKQVLGPESFAGAEAAKQTAEILVRSARNRFFSGDSAPAWRLRKAANASAEVFASLVAKNRSVLYALRTDKESATSTLPSGNIDVSKMFEYGTYPPSVAKRATAAMLSFFDRFERIVTDRLHGCILAALLGKNVDFYANDYFKNEAVYAFSLKDRYPNVTWQGAWRDTAST